MGPNRILNRPLIHFLLIAVLGMVVYSNTFDVPFHFDDRKFIVDNPFMKDFSYFFDPSGVDTMTERLNLSTEVARLFKNRPVGYLTLWASHRLVGLEVQGYHAVNLAVHIINAILVYLIVLLTFRTPLLEGSSLKGHSHLIALFSGFLFVAHPLQTETVTYIIKRVVLLASMFYLASTAAYIGSRLSKGKVRYGLYALALLFAVLGMKTKENVFTLPVAIGLYEFMFFRDGIKGRLLRLAPLLLTMLIIPLEYIGQVTGGGLSAVLDSATRYPNAPPRLDYLIAQFSVVVKYMLLLLVPAGQSVDHWHSVYDSFLEPAVLISILFLLSFFGIGLYLYKRSRVGERALRIAAFGIFWFFLTLSVESSVLPIGIVMAEYRVYLPSFGIFILASSIPFMATGPNTRIYLAALALVVIVFSSASYARNRIWHDEFSLWMDVVEKSPVNVRGHNNLGNAYRNRGLHDRAIEHYRIALSLNPDFEEAQYNIGNTYNDQGLVEKAMEHYRKVLSLDPDHAEAHYNLGLVYFNKGMLGEALEHNLRALNLKPDYAEAHVNIGCVYGSKGLLDKAVEHLETALSLNPDYSEAHYNLGLAYFNKGLLIRARVEFDAALELDPLYREARQYLEKLDTTQSH
jgi:tetratricopeptide (TPR) repeat protein